MAYTLLSGLADKVKTTIETAPETAWGDYKVGVYVAPEIAIDPLVAVESVESKPRLFVVPLTTQLDIPESQGRDKIRQLAIKPTVAVVLAVPFKAIQVDSLDVTPWSEGSKVLDLRENLDIYLALTDWAPYKLMGMTPEPAQELMLKTRVFMSVTELEFEGNIC